MRIAILVPVALGLVALSAEPAASQDVVVVVNSSNPVTELSRAAVERLFLRQQTRWATGVEVAPVEPPEESDLRDQFSTSFLRRSKQQVRAHWVRSVFSGGQVPPPTRDTEAEVLDFVRSNPGAIGYVLRSTAVGARVQVVTVTGL